MTDNRMGVPLITDILDALDRHGYTRSDTAHTARAIVLISDLAHIYEGSQDHPFVPTAARYRRRRSRLHPNRPARTASS